MSHKKFPYPVRVEDIPPTVKVVVHVAGEDKGRPHYQCPDHCWREHFDEWVRHRRRDREGTELYPEPMPWGHCMFERPLSYGMVPWGCADQEMIRKAHEVNVRAFLSAGWDRELKKTERGRVFLEKLVKAAVDAQMDGAAVSMSLAQSCLMFDL